MNPMEWTTIESDPGVFTELIHNIGVKGVQVEEVSDMDYLSSEIDPVFGLIFLFKYMHNSGYTPNVLSHWDPDLFFAKQVIQNACATQAILGVLMNNTDKIDIGPTLKEFKSFTSDMDPNLKGLAIANSEKIREEHNKFSRPEPFIFTKEKAEDGDDVFHFVAYVHFKKNIYEIDGLQEGPILIKENVEEKNWVNEVKPEIINRINLYCQNEIKFNLLKVIPSIIDKAKSLENDLIKRKIYIENLLGIGAHEGDFGDIEKEYSKLSKEQLNKCLSDFESEIQKNKYIIAEEEEKLKKSRQENERRQHNYIPFVFECLKLMAEDGTLAEAYKEAVEKAKIKKEQEKNKESNNGK